MNDTDKLNWLLRMVVTAGGPARLPNETDDLLILRIANWLMRRAPSPTVPPPDDQPKGCGPDCCRERKP
jgi:hypothetical protein